MNSDEKIIEQLQNLISGKSVEVKTEPKKEEKKEIFYYKLI